MALAAILPLIAGCGGSGHGRLESHVHPADAATVRTADCTMWNGFSGPERARLVAGLRTFFGGRVDRAGTWGQVLPDHAANTLLNTYCRQTFARAFMLYRIYGNAAAFTPPRRPSSSASAY